MQSLKERIRFQEYEIGNDRAALANEFALFRKTLATPKYVGLSFLGGFALGLLLKHPHAEAIKRKITQAPTLMKQITSHLQFLLPILLG